MRPKCLAAVGLVWLAASTATSAQPLSTVRDRAERLTLELMADQGRYLATPAAERSPLVQQLAALAEERQAALAALIDADPATVLRLALPEGARASMPDEARAYAETLVSIDGVLQVQVEDYARSARLRHFLNAGGVQLSLHFAAQPAALLTGDRVRVRGVRVGNALALQSGSTSVQSLSSIAPNTFGEQKTLIILVNFQDNQSQPYGVGDAYNVAFGTTSDYDREASFGQTWLSGDVVGWYTIPLSSTGCDNTSIATYAKKAASSAGVNLNQYNRYVYAFPNNACAWWGLGTLGGNPSQAWVNGSFQLKVLAHEMGHNFGLYHAHSLDCGSDPIGPSCSWSEYGDTIDMMGLESAGHFAAFAKERLGWLNYSSSPPLTTVTTSGTYRIEPYSAYGTGSKGLKVLQSVSSTGQRTWYYVEYRSASGFDSFLGGNTNITGGVVIRTGAESSADSSYLLDMTPETDSWYDPALVVGRSFTDPAAGITITPTSIDSTGAAVYVQVGAVTCTRSAPAVAISPSPTVWASPGSQVQFSVTVTNQDASGCPASTFALSDVIPPGWVASFAAADLTTTPGSAASTSMSVGVPSGTAGGMYTITASANAADAPSLAASASVTCALPSDTNATLQVSSDKPSYSKNQSVTVSGVLTVNSVAVQGTSVTFTVTRPDGSKLTGSGVTDASGRGAWTFRLKGNPPRGTYNVVASASVGGVATSGTAAFIVQ